MVTICLQCGDAGYANAYVYCVKCLMSAVHRYCLPEIPKTFDEFVSWVCDDCKEVLSASRKAVLNTYDGRCSESVVSASTSGSNKKSISQSSPQEDENCGKTEPMIQSVPENLGLSGDARQSDDCCLSGVEPNANNDWSPKESVPMKHVHRSDTSRQLDGVKKVEVEADELLQRTNLGKKTEVSSSVSGKEKQRLPTTTDQKIFDGEHQRDGKEEAEAVADGLSKRTRSGKKYEVSFSVSGKEKQKLPTTADQKIFDGEHQSNGKEEGELVADRFSKRTRFGKNSGISTPVPEKEKQNHTTSMHFPTISIFREETSQLTHEARGSTHDTVRERDKECGKEESFVVPTQSNVNGEDSQQTHEAGRPMHIRERDNELVKEESLVIPTRSTVKEELSRYPIMTLPIAELTGYSLQAKPQVDAIWRGKFHIVNKKDETFEGFVAHLSTTACKRVIEEARLLPAVLQLEMVPKSTVWPKIFQEALPSVEHIALYIFPADRRYEKKFDSLADDMSKENLAMRSISKNAELLIFPSTELQPMTSWRYQSKYYIWGVFKKNRSVSFDT